MQAMMDCMSNMGMMMNGMALVGLLGLAVVVLVAAAATKYLFFANRRGRQKLEQN